MKKLFALGILVLLMASCGASSDQKQVDNGNPAAPGFNMEGSDEKAIAIADEVMDAMGGREAWDNTHYVCWTFFGRDALVWDKWTGNVRIDAGNGMTYLTNINDETGRAFMNGEEVMADADSISGLMQRAKSTWINHSYWLVMPFKLKDSGVTLTYAGEEATEDGRIADKLKLTFEGVGRTPQNMYYVWVDKEKKLVSQWAYYPTADAEEPRFTMPWLEYNAHGDILLSTSRGQAKMEDIMVFDELPGTVFTSPEKPDLKAMMQKD